MVSRLYRGEEVDRDSPSLMHGLPSESPQKARRLRGLRELSGLLDAFLPLFVHRRGRGRGRGRGRREIAACGHK